MIAQSPWAPRLPLSTERLELRGHRTDDIDDLVVFHSDPRITKYLPWPVRDRRQTAEALEKKVHQAQAPDEGDWLVLAVVERSTGRVIGELDLKHGPARSGEIGYVIAGDRQGQGFGTEALAELLRFALDDLRLNLLDAFISPGNTASVALVRKFGFQRNSERDSLDPSNPTQCFQLRRSE